MSSKPPAAVPANDLEIIKGKLDHLITVVETRKALVERFDDRLVRAEKLERSLGSTALKLAAARALTTWPTAAVAGAIAGGLVAWFLHATLAFAH